MRTLFGTLRLASPRWWHCPCRPRPTRTFSPLAAALPDRATPELVYLQAKFAGLVSYGLSAKLLAEVLPLGRTLHATAVRRTPAGSRSASTTNSAPNSPFFIEGCPADWAELPRPDLPLTVSLDGGYVHSARQRSRRDGWFEVIAGKSVPADGPAKCFGFVQTYDTKPKRRLFEVLAAQGMQANQQVTFLTDGADDVRDLPLYLNPQAEHLLDWFHVTMRLTVLTQLAKGLRAPPPAVSADSVAAQLARLKWFCWHGNVFRALQTVEDIEFDLDVDDAGPEQRKLLQGRRRVRRLPAGQRRQHPQLRGALPGRRDHLQLLRRVHRQPGHQQADGQEAADALDAARRAPAPQVRTRVLNDDLADDFRRWHPGFTHTTDPEALAA